MHNIIRELEIQLGDVAYDTFDVYTQGGAIDPMLYIKIQELEKGNVRDIPGALADHMHNIPDILSGLIGDRVGDEVGSDITKRISLLKELKKDAHFQPLQTAITNLLEEEDAKRNR